MILTKEVRAALEDAEHHVRQAMGHLALAQKGCAAVGVADGGIHRATWVLEGVVDSIKRATS